MSLSQPKVDLAVLYHLHQWAEIGGGAITPDDIVRDFKVRLSIRRVEVALDELQSKRDVDREYHPHYSDEGLWQISRSGIMKVDRALKVPTSFIARLHANGDGWLESDEAKQAVLKTLDPPSTKLKPAAQADAALAAGSVLVGRALGIDWTKWGTIFAAISIAVTVLLWWLS